MDIEIRDVLELDDNKEYIVISKVVYENINYYYLVELNNKENIKFLYEDKDELVELKDDGILKKILPKFYQNSHHILKEMLKNMEK